VEGSLCAWRLGRPFVAYTIDYSAINQERQGVCGAIFALTQSFFGAIILSMEKPKRPPGRPPLGETVEDRRRLPVYGTDEDMERLRVLAERWHCSRSEAARRAIREASEREGSSSGPTGELRTRNRRKATAADEAEE
jgi:hypothetical protein